MKKIIIHLFSSLGFILITSLAFAADTNQPPQIRIQMRDGSRIMGIITTDNFKFNSSLIGNVKVAVKDIRTIDCTSTNETKLTTKNGDALLVSLLDSSIKIKTSFGSVEIPKDSFQTLSVISSPATDTLRLPGLVALWSGEDNALDSAGNNNGTLEGKITFATGKIGQAFHFNEESDDVKIPASQSINVGEGDGFTLMAWINPLDPSQLNPIFEWNSGDDSFWGAHFYVQSHPNPGTLYVNLMTKDGGLHQMFSPGDIVLANTFQHVAFTYSRSSGLATMYCNGVMVAQQNMGNIIPQTSYNLYLGKRPLSRGETYTFRGLLDEAAIYNRALSAEEIKSICLHDNNGEMPPAPNASASSTRSYPIDSNTGLPLNGLIRGRLP